MGSANDDFSKCELQTLISLYQWARRSSWKAPGQKVKGRGIEFGSYRDYVVGDDLRQIDWVVYARLSRLVVKVTEDLPEPHVELILDSSASMAAGFPAVLPTAAFLGSALGAVFMARGSLVRIRDGSGQSSAESYRGQGRLLALLEAMKAFKSGGRVDLTKAAGSLLGKKHRSVLVLSDGLMDEEGFLPPLKRLQQAGHAVFVVLVRPPEEAPAHWLGGAGRGQIWDLEGAESGFVEKRFINAEILAEMSEKRSAILSSVSQKLSEAHLSWTIISSDMSVQRAIQKLFASWTGESSLAGS
jgi:uncharacterized protein (DUF58 family)